MMVPVTQWQCSRLVIGQWGFDSPLAPITSRPESSTSAQNVNRNHQMRFIEIKQDEFVSIDAIAEVSLPARVGQQQVQNPDTNSPYRSTALAEPTATIRLVNGTVHILTGEMIEVLRREIEGNRLN